MTYYKIKQDQIVTRRNKQYDANAVFELVRDANSTLKLRDESGEVFSVDAHLLEKFFRRLPMTRNEFDHITELRKTRSWKEVAKEINWTKTVGSLNGQYLTAKKEYGLPSQSEVNIGDVDIIKEIIGYSVFIERLINNLPKIRQAMQALETVNKLSEMVMAIDGQTDDVDVVEPTDEVHLPPKPPRSVMPDEDAEVTVDDVKHALDDDDDNAEVEDGYVDDHTKDKIIELILDGGYTDSLIAETLEVTIDTVVQVAAEIEGDLHTADDI